MPTRLQLSGMTFGRLTVVKRSGQAKNRSSLWLCVCECGVIASFPSSSLLRRATQSCGCLQRELVAQRLKTHGMVASDEYRTWAGMIQRCTNPNQRHWKYYGGRGITVCDRWRNSFESFYADMGERPKGKSIDRINNDGNYEPSNCRWATRVDQNRNQRQRRRKPRSEK